MKCPAMGLSHGGTFFWSICGGLEVRLAAGDIKERLESCAIGGYVADAKSQLTGRYSVHECSRRTLCGDSPVVG